MIEAIALIFALGFFAVLALIMIAITQVRDELKEIAHA